MVTKRKADQIVPAHLQGCEVRVLFLPFLDGSLRFEPTMQSSPAMVTFQSVVPGHAQWGEALSFRTDIFAMRDAFMRLQNLSQALEFVRAYGPLEVEGDVEGLKPSERARSVKGVPFTWERLSEIRDEFKAAFLHPESGMAAPALDFRVRLNVGSDSATAPLRCGSVVQALMATAYLRSLKDTVWRECPICGVLFEDKTGRGKVFCTAKCSNINAAREYKAKNRPNKTKPNKRAVIPND